MTRLAFRYSTSAMLALGTLVAGIYANEAEKEVRILCGMLGPGSSLARVEQLLETADLLHVSTEASGEYRRLEISSWFNLRLTGCSLELENEMVTESTYRPTPWSD